MKTYLSLGHILGAAAFATAGAGLDAHAGPIQASQTPGALVPDGSDSGLVSVLDIQAPGESISDVNVTVTLAAEPGGAWNGDLYIYLAHNGKLSVLANRPGVSASNAFGYGDPGLAGVTFNDELSLGDFHTYQVALNAGDSTSPISGTFQPDARTALPDVVTTSSPRSAFLSQFDGLEASGEWRLFVADLSLGGQVRLVSWSVEINATELPDPLPLLGWTGFASALVLAWSKRRRAE